MRTIQRNLDDLDNDILDKLTTKGPLHTRKLSRILDKSTSVVHRHLKKLYGLGYLKEEKKGKTILYRIIKPVSDEPIFMHEFPVEEYRTVVRAPGNLVINAEHGVLCPYNLAIIMPIASYTYVGFRKAKSSDVSAFQWRKGDLKPYPQVEEYISEIQTILKKQLEIEEEVEGRVKIVSDLPIGRGLGSSSALAVALTVAVGRAYGHFKDLNNWPWGDFELLMRQKRKDIDKIARCGHRIEERIQENSSGVHILSSILGGQNKNCMLAYIRKSRKDDDLDFSVKRINVHDEFFRSADESFSGCIILTPREATTKQAIRIYKETLDEKIDELEKVLAKELEEDVKRHKFLEVLEQTPYSEEILSHRSESLEDDFPKSFLLKTIYKLMSQISALESMALSTGKTSIFYELLNMQHNLLSTLKLSSYTVDEIASYLRSEGKGGKMSGGGCGGAVFAYAPIDIYEKIRTRYGTTRMFRERNIEILNPDWHGIKPGEHVKILRGEEK